MSRSITFAAFAIALLTAAPPAVVGRDGFARLNWMRPV